jgi:hypothetical protein
MNPVGTTGCTNGRKFNKARIPVELSRMAPEEYEEGFAFFLKVLKKQDHFATDAFARKHFGFLARYCDIFITRKGGEISAMCVYSFLQLSNRNIVGKVSIDHALLMFVLSPYNAPASLMLQDIFTIQMAGALCDELDLVTLPVKIITLSKSRYLPFFCYMYYLDNCSGNGFGYNNTKFAFSGCKLSGISLEERQKAFEKEKDALMDKMRLFDISMLDLRKEFEGLSEDQEDELRYFVDTHSDITDAIHEAVSSMCTIA